MAASSSLLPLGCVFDRSTYSFDRRIVCISNGIRRSKTARDADDWIAPEEKPRLCDDTCENELEKVPMLTTESGLQYQSWRWTKSSRWISGGRKLCCDGSFWPNIRQFIGERAALHFSGWLWSGHQGTGWRDPQHESWRETPILHPGTVSVSERSGISTGKAASGCK